MHVPAVARRGRQAFLELESQCELPIVVLVTEPQPSARAVYTLTAEPSLPKCRRS